MNFFTGFSLKNTFVVILAGVLILVGGLYSGKGIKEEAMPNINIPVVTVFTVYPGAAPEDIADGITRPIQKSLSGIEGITDIKGISNENVSIVVAEFDYSADIDKGERDIQDAVNTVSFPDNAQKPTISKVTMGSFPVMTYSLQSSKSIDVLTQFVNSTLKPELSGVTGVANVNVNGLKTNDIYIKLDDQKMKDQNITLQDVQSALTANNISYPVGSTEINQKDLTIRVTRKFNNLDDIKSVPIVVMPNTTKLMGNSLTQIGEGMNKLGQAVGQLGQEVGTTSKTMGEMIGNNTQAIALLSVIQQQEGIILAQQAILANFNSTPQNKVQAQAAIAQANSVIQSTATSLQQVLSAQTQKGKELSQGASSNPGVSNSNPNPNPNSLNSAASPAPTLHVVFLKDIANIDYGTQTTSFFTRANFKEGMVLNIYKTDDANMVQLARDVDQKISEVTQGNGDIQVYKINDSSTMVKDSVNGMISEGITGALFAMIVIALFLRDIKSTVIAVVSIPLSVLIALILLPRFNITLNTMSLGGIAVAVGRIVDDSIVVIENIYRRLEQARDQAEDRTDLIRQASQEVGSAIAASTITTVGVFLPLSFITGIIGRVFIPFAYTVVICISASLLVALTVVPVMSKFMLFRKKSRPSAAPEKNQGKMAEIYKKVLGSVLNHRLLVIGASLIILLISLGLIRKIGIQFMPASTSNVINVALTMPAGTAVDKTNTEALKFESFLKGRKDIDKVTSIIGDTSSSGGSVLSNQGANEGSFIVVVKEKADLTQALDDLTAEARKFNQGGEVMTLTPQSITGNKAENVEVIIKGSSLEDITKAAGIITAKLRGMEELNNLTNNISARKPEISVAVDAAKAADQGLNPAVVAAIVRNYLGYSKITTVDNGSAVDVLLGYPANLLNNIDSIKNLEIPGAEGPIKIGDIASVEQEDGPATISELDGKQYASVVADIKGNDTSKVTKDAQTEIDSIRNTLPPGVSYELQGSNKDITSGFSQMGFAMFVAIVLVYIVMVITFGEPLTPFAILFSLPFAAVGAIVALFIARQPLTVSGMIGMLMLIGIVVTNAIVLLDRVRTNRISGMKVREALLEAGSVRIRPILMTAISTIMALIPLALGFSHGSLISQGLGIVVIGGLVFSTVLTLILVPVMYSILMRSNREQANPG
ncbi:efflux RND transporter permease subunit [Desulfosporosinus sp. PR]|uniref:efflux RND transporter permease subunit n=1 Tax=Candidatus Desulfosporosinus nitrosoreducens TaxID=3401928 RepID=UPI0027F4F516|nr:efflux RND transporter permease subunit [Desulfosporosinus sp. PR]MDQ7095338.1 efflux RND transporter permease subunit [Desulfosporosinus sp. PR]